MGFSLHRHYAKHVIRLVIISTEKKKQKLKCDFFFVHSSIFLLRLILPINFAIQIDIYARQLVRLVHTHLYVGYIYISMRVSLDKR